MRIATALGLLLPILRLRLWSAGDERQRFLLVRDCARRVLRAGGCRVSLRTSAELPRATPVMFVSNHTSLADAAVLLAALPVDVRFVANHVFARYPLLGAAIRASSAHIVDRGSWRSRGECGRVMQTALAGGQSLLVFPEGTTSPDGRLLAFRSGAFRAAAACGAPVVPIVLRGTRDLFPPDTRWLHDAAVDVEILPPLQSSGTSRQAAAALKASAVAAIAARLGDPQTTGAV